jgi:glutathione S-transferase
MAGERPNDNGGKDRMAAVSHTLVIGDKNYSSWSLRPWLAMKYFRLAFAEERIRLRKPESRAAILRHSPSGKVPALKTNGLVVFESLAIIEYLADRNPELQLWPRDPEARAFARSISAEMHAGFATLRNELPMNLLARLPTPPIGEELEWEIRRVILIWRNARARHGANGPFLFGAFSGADAMFAPVATRFRTYGVEPTQFGDDGDAALYASTLLALPAMAEWTKGAKIEMEERRQSA